MPVLEDDPDLFLATSDLELVAHAVVEGALAGLHRSPWIGSSVEFEAHRDYQKGDDLRYVNWNLWARNNRLYVKQFRADTNLNLYLLVDCSASMKANHGKASKWAYASRIAAAMAMLANRAHDATALLLLRDGVADFIPPKTGQAHFHDVVAALDRCEPSGAGDLAESLRQAPDYCRRRGVVVILSDFFDEGGEFRARINDLRAWGHDVILLQVLDAWEHALPTEGHYLVRDLETGVELRTDAAGVRAATTARVEAWRESLRAACIETGVDWLSTTTDQPLVDTLAQYLIQRAEARIS